jgi:hypothetical protein
MHYLYLWILSLYEEFYENTQELCRIIGHCRLCVIRSPSARDNKDYFLL